MTHAEIDLTRAYLDGAGQDPIAALIWAVKDLAREQRKGSRGDGGWRTPPTIAMEEKSPSSRGVEVIRD